MAAAGAKVVIGDVLDGLGRQTVAEINAAGGKIQAVTAADVQRVARTYFTKENRAVATYTRKAGAAPVHAGHMANAWSAPYTWCAPPGAQAPGRPARAPCPHSQGHQC